MSKEDSEIDIIKDFLKSRGYKNALEGLEKDDYKTIEKKKVTKYFMDYFSERIHIRISQAKRGIWLSPGETKHELLAVPSLWSCTDSALVSQR